jgi:ubiquinol-cytochrome c reductase iron-sulfur subunit
MLLGTLSRACSARASGRSSSIVSRKTTASSVPTRSFRSSTALKAELSNDPSYTVGRPVSHFPSEKFDKYLRSDTSPEAKKGFSYFVVGTAMAGVGIAAKSIIQGALGMLQPTGAVLALANIEVDLSNIAEGSTVTVSWRGKPLFIKHRTPEEIETARSTPLSELPDKQTDEERAPRPEWLIVVGVCTHLGCVPLANQGEYHGWFCPCHGSHYDLSGRIRKGPAPANLEIPPYSWIDDTKILVGGE